MFGFSVGPGAATGDIERFRVGPRGVRRGKGMKLVQGAASLSVVMAVAAIAASTPAAAVSKSVKSACKSDYKRLCPSYPVGSASLKACMDAKQGEISGPCRDSLINSGEVDRYRSEQARRKR